MFHTMINVINAVAGFGRARLRNTVLAGAALTCIPAAALARHPNFHLDVMVPPPAIYVDPACPPTRQWVEPVYQTITEQVWVPAVTMTQIQHVDVPAQYEWRDVVSYDSFGRPHRFHQQVLISPPHCEDRQVDVIVTPAHYEQQTHQQLVCEGHWQEMAVPVAVVQPGMHIEFPFPF